jgi:hypothetical protein
MLRPLQQVAGPRDACDCGRNRRYKRFGNRKKALGLVRLTEQIIKY